MRRPLAVIVVSFCLGISFSSIIRLRFFWVYIFAVSMTVICLLRIKAGRFFSVFLILLCFSLGILLFINTYVLPRNHIARVVHFKNLTVSLQGTIDSDPIEGPNRTSFVLKAEKIKAAEGWRRICGKVLIKTASKEDLFYGDRVILEGSLYRPFNFGISERFKYRDYLRHKGIYVILNNARYDRLERTESRQANPLIFFILKIRHRVKDLVDRNISDLAGSILNAVILGLRKGLTPEIRDILVNTGTVHIIAISGLHLCIVAFMVLIFLKLIRIPRRPRHIIAVFVLFLYCILTGASVPVTRATIMATILLLGYTIKRDADVYNSLALACLIILSINPWQIFEVSFQLSFLSIIALVWLSPKIYGLFPERLKKPKYARLLVGAFSCSLAAWLGLLPLIIYYFKIISPVTILANMIVVPYMSLVIACGFVFILAGLIFPAAVSLFSPVTEICVLFLLKFLSLLSQIPFGHFHLR